MQKNDLNVSSAQKNKRRRSIAFISIFCSFTIVLAAVVFYLSKNYPSRTDMEEPPLLKDQLEVSKTVSSSVVLQKNEEGYYIIPEENIEQFRIKEVGNETLDYLRGAAGGQISLFQPESVSVVQNDKINIFTATVEDRLVLCGTPWSEDSSCISKDGLTIVYLGHDPTEERFGLMTYNVETKTSQLVSSDVYDGKTAAYFQEISLGDGYGVKWIENPVLSEDNLLIAYDSNRRTYEDYLKEVQEYGGEWDESDPKNDHVSYPATDIWVKDLASGEEYLLLKNAGVQFWVGRSLVYMAHDGSSQSNLNIINLDTKEIKQLPEGLIKIVPNSFYISNWEEEVFQLYNVKTDISYTFPLQEQGLQVIEKEIFAGEDGKEYALSLIHICTGESI